MPRSRGRVRGQGRPLTQLELHACCTPPLCHRGAAPSKPVVRRGAREERVSYCNSQEPWKGQGVREETDLVGTSTPSACLHCGTGVRRPPR